MNEDTALKILIEQAKQRVQNLFNEGWDNDQISFCFKELFEYAENDAVFVWTDEKVKEYATAYRISSTRISIKQFKEKYDEYFKGNSDSIKLAT